MTKKHIKAHGSQTKYMSVSVTINPSFKVPKSKLKAAAQVALDKIQWPTKWPTTK